MKKRLCILLCLLALTWSAAYAQSLSDQKVMSIAIEMYKQGQDEMAIAKSLIMQGATLDQLERIKDQLSKEISTGRKDSQMSLSTSLNGRVNNEEPLLFIPSFQEENTPREEQVFGQNIFRESKMSFEPSMNLATPKNYVLGAGDEVIIEIYGASQQQYRETISPEGSITISGYGPIQLGGLDIQQAGRRLRQTLGTRYQQCQIALSVGQTRTISIHVMGEVEVPGTYQLSAFANVFHALYMAGGINDMGTLRAIKVYRNGKLIYTIDLYDYLMNGNMAGHTRLEEGDVILVGTYEQRVKMTGKVKRPMFYELLPEETMDKLIYYAGGFSGDAYTAAIRVNRRAGGAQSVLTAINSDFGLFRMMDGDIAQVDSILPRMKNTISIAGSVFRPGQYGISESIHTIRQLVEAANGPSEDAFLKRAVLYRMKLDRTLQAIPIELEEILNGNAEDIELKNEDELFVPSVQEKLEKQYVVIHGEVYHPDTFHYAENESVEDLILRAGGLTDKAATSKVDISRRVIDPKSTGESMIKSKTYTVELHDSLKIDEHGFILEPFDEVYVRMSPSYGKQMNVRVRGEILYNGTYAMKTQDDRLSDLVKAAGGVTSHAYIQGARLMRNMTEDERMRRDQLVKINKTASSKDSVNMDKLDIANTYYVGIDLEAALTNPGSNEDLVLREGDVLIIPSINSTVKINGEVMFPNTVSYIKGKRAYYYIKQAGGYGNMARRSKVYILYSGGKVGSKMDKIQPGCEIVVPSRTERKSNNAAQAVAIASSAASMASVVATITTLIINQTKKN